MEPAVPAELMKTATMVTVTAAALRALANAKSFCLLVQHAKDTMSARAPDAHVGNEIGLSTVSKPLVIEKRETLGQLSPFKSRNKTKN